MWKELHRAPVPVALGGSSHRSEHANVREEGARLHWPPSARDDELDALAARRTLDDEDGEARRRLLRRRGAPNAQRSLDAELEEQLTNLVMMMTLEAAAVGRT